MLIASPESLKTTFIESVFKNFESAIVLGDLTTAQMSDVREDIANRRYTTIALPEFQKIYDRDPRVASNIEGSLKLLMEEGFSYIPGGPVDLKPKTAKALVILGVLDSLFSQRYQRWKQSGLLRRMLMVKWVLDKPYLLSKAVDRWERLCIRAEKPWSIPIDLSIPHEVSEKEQKLLSLWCKEQAGMSTPKVLLHRILSVLRWRYKSRKERDVSISIVKDFSECLTGWGKLHLEFEQNGKKRA